MKRRLKIEEMGDAWRRKTKATIRLKGKWLQAAGFVPGGHVQLTILASGLMVLQAVPSLFEPAQSDEQKTII